MSPDSRPLLRSSLDYSPSSETLRTQLNRSMSLRAALLAFPLPAPSSSDPRPRRRHSVSYCPRPSPLKRYNSNYKQLTHERSLRVKARHSRIHATPVYAMPTSYDGLQKRFPCTRPMTSSSTFVEPDLSLPSLDVPMKGNQVGARETRGMPRETLVRSGTIARKQRLRKKSRQKPPSEISINLLRSTTSVLGRTVHKAKDAIGSTTKQVSRVFRGLKRGKENRDDFHRYIYDLHLREDEMEERSVASIPRVGESRYGTWTNLSGVMGLEKDEMPVIEREEVRLETIQEVTEVSEGAKQKDPSYNAVANFLHSLGEERVTEEEIPDVDVNTIPSRKPSHISINSGQLTPQSLEPASPTPSLLERTSDTPLTQIKLTPPLPPRNSPANSITTPSPSPSLLTSHGQTLLQPHPSSTAYSDTQDIDPIKPSISTRHSIHLPAEITRSSSSISNDLSEKQRVVSVISNAVSTYSQEEKSVPILDAWRWSPAREEGKSVKERVRELDLAIDGARNMERSQRGENGFGGWRG